MRAFYANLAESGVRLDTKYTCNISIDDYLRENELTTAELCRRSGISNTTMISIRKGNNVNQQNAEKLDDLFIQQRKKSASHKDDLNPHGKQSNKIQDHQDTLQSKHQ